MMSVSAATMPRMLIADDQPDVVEALRLLLKQEGYEVEGVNSPAGVLESLKSRDFDLLLMDLNYTRDTTSGREGLDLLSHIRAFDSTLPIVVMTAWGSIDLALEAVHRGVGDFVLKPWDNTRLLRILREQLEVGEGRRKAQQQQAEENQERAEAREMQQGLLPAVMPQIDGYEIAGAWQPVRNVGGDYFDVFVMGDGRLALCIADVIGKGMPAALLMSNLQAALKATAAEAAEPRDLAGRVNRIIRNNTSQGKFITLFYGCLEAREKRLSFTNAGHNAPILLRRDASCLRLERGGAALGGFPDWQYDQGEVQLTSGDRLVLFTDGVTEVRDAAGEEFGEERLLQLLTQNRSLSAEELQKKILATVARFGAGDFQDDATVVVVAVN